MISRRSFLRGAAAAGPLAAGGSLLGPATLGVPFPALAQPGGDSLSAQDVNGLTLIRGAGANVVAMPGMDGALMIDAGSAPFADALLAAVLAATESDRVDMLINTHWHPAQTGANPRVGEAGGRIFAHENTLRYLSHPVYSALFEGRLDPLPATGWPTATTRGDGTLEFAGERVDFGYLPAAHTDGDLYLHFPSRDVVAAGGVVAGDRWPLLDYRNGAWYGGRVRALEWLAELVSPDTQVIPADGPVITGRDVVRQRDICLELFETLIGYMNMGFGPEDAAAADPLAAHRGEFGDSYAFLYGAYRSMLIAYVPD